MKACFALVVFLYGASCLATTHHVPIDENDHGPHLPQVGSSLFDKIFSQKSQEGHVLYDVPYPLDSLLSKITGMGGDFVHSMFPLSRSLQRPQDLSYDPLLNPRIVLATNSDDASLTRGKLFIGFVKAKDQLEVISYNDEAGRFEYQVVVDYSKKPEVFYVDRGKCLSCHQGQAAIFSPPPWADSSFGVMGRLVDKKLGLSGDPRENRQARLNRLFGSVKSNEEIAMLDSLVRESNQITVDERIWLYGCNSDATCRLGLLLRTLSPNSTYTRAYFKHAQSVIGSSDLTKQGYFSSFLSSTDLGVDEVIEKYGTIDGVVNNSEALLDLVGLLYRLPPKDNPATLRSNSMRRKALAGPLASFLLSDIDKLNSEIPNPNDVGALLVHLYESGHPIFKQDALNKLEVMAAILSEANSPKAVEYNYWLSKKTPSKKLLKQNRIPVFTQPELNIFARYCYKCHGIGLQFPPQFLLGTEDEVMTQISQFRSMILFKLENKLMPPSQAERTELERSGDYSRLVEYVKSLPSQL